MRHGSLFSGLGGFDLAATWAGWQNVFNCEKDAFCRRVLNHYWPNTESYGDIYGFDATKYRGLVDIISGGFPCQPFSLAGKRKGKNDDRYLFPQALRIIQQSRPRWVVLENVAGIFTILEPESLSEMEHKAVELFCENNEQETGAVIERIQQRVLGAIVREIGAAGYIFPSLTDGTPVVLCVPACAVNAPHRRDRAWIVAYADSCAGEQRTGGPGGGESLSQPQKGWQPQAGDAARQTDPVGSGPAENTGDHSEWRDDAHADGAGLERSQSKGLPQRSGQFTWRREIPGWNAWPAQSPVCGRDDGLSARLDGISFPKYRDESLKAYGNAIVPQVALEIFKVIEQVEKQWYETK